MLLRPARDDAIDDCLGARILLSLGCCCDVIEARGAASCDVVEGRGNERRCSGEERGDNDVAGVFIDGRGCSGGDVISA